MKMPNLWSKMLQNVTEFRCLIHEMLRNAVAELTECHEKICKLN